jgi:glycosyltransferase involved in cell wall biosynthesis
MSATNKASLSMRITVIISAYKNCKALQYCLEAYRLQTRKPDQIIVAEDDQSDDIKELLLEFAIPGVELRHVSQPNQGFRKCTILNQAISQATGDLLIFTDADCIARNDFVETHARKARRGTFLAGGSHINLPQEFHQYHDICDLIANQSLFDYAYLSVIPGFDKERLRLTRNKTVAACMDLLTQRNAFSGATSSAFREDVLAVRGFDESMGYGGEDTNFGIRLNNLGIKGRRIRYSLCCIHLDHPRSYVNKEVVMKNKLHNKKTKKAKAIYPLRSSL